MRIAGIWGPAVEKAVGEDFLELVGQLGPEPRGNQGNSKWKDAPGRRRAPETELSCVDPGAQCDWRT